jgi:hypothetical protein
MRFLKLEALPVLLGTVSAGPIGPGALYLAGTDQTWWPVSTCLRDKACYDWKIEMKPGWSGSKAENLKCDVNEDRRGFFLIKYIKYFLHFQKMKNLYSLLSPGKTKNLFPILLTGK